MGATMHIPEIEDSLRHVATQVNQAGGEAVHGDRQSMETALSRLDLQADLVEQCRISRDGSSRAEHLPQVSARDLSRPDVHRDGDSLQRRRHLMKGSLDVRLRLFDERDLDLHVLHDDGRPHRDAGADPYPAQVHDLNNRDTGRLGKQIVS